MCFPPALIALAATAIGGGLKFIGDKQAERASNNTFNAEHLRQQQFTADQTGKFQDSLDKTKTLLDPGAQKDAIAAREGTLAQQIAPVPASGSYLPGSSSAPLIVATAQDKASAHSTAVSSNLAHLIATLGGQEDQKQGVDIGIGRNSDAIGQIGSFSRGSAGVLDAELRAAAQKGAFLRGLGGFVSQAGQAIGAGVGGGNLGTGAAKAGAGAADIFSGAGNVFSGYGVH